MTEERMIHQLVIVVRVQVLDVWYSVGQIENILNREIVMFQSISYSPGMIHWFSYLGDLLVVWYFVVDLTEIVVARLDREEGRQPETEPELFPLRCPFLRLRLKIDFSTEKCLSCLLELKC